MSSLRLNLRKLVDTGNKIRQTLGYQEFIVTLPNGKVLDPRPQVITKTLRAYSDSQIQEFTAAVQGGNPTEFYEVHFSRLTAEAKVREDGYWNLYRELEDFQAKAVPVQIQVLPLKFVVTLAIIKELEL